MDSDNKVLLDIIYKLFLGRKMEKSDISHWTKVASKDYISNVIHSDEFIAQVVPRIEKSKLEKVIKNDGMLDFISHFLLASYESQNTSMLLTFEGKGRSKQQVLFSVPFNKTPIFDNKLENLQELLGENFQNGHVSLASYYYAHHFVSDFLLYNNPVLRLDQIPLSQLCSQFFTRQGLIENIFLQSCSQTSDVIAGERSDLERDNNQLYILR
jgi:hypothetical protein